MEQLLNRAAVQLPYHHNYYYLTAGRIVCYTEFSRNKLINWFLKWSVVKITSFSNIRYIRNNNNLSVSAVTVKAWVNTSCMPRQLMVTISHRTWNVSDQSLTLERLQVHSLWNRNRLLTVVNNVERSHAAGRRTYVRTYIYAYNISFLAMICVRYYCCTVVGPQGGCQSIGPCADQNVLRFIRHILLPLLERWYYEAKQLNPLMRLANDRANDHVTPVSAPSPLTFTYTLRK